MIIIAWAGPQEQPRLHGTPLYVSIFEDRALASSDPYILSHLALDTPTSQGPAEPKDRAVEYWIAFTDNNTEYNKIILSLPGIRYLEDFTWTIENQAYPSIKIMSTAKQIFCFMDLDFVFITGLPIDAWMPGNTPHVPPNR
jgi:hypothetical protein